MPRFVFCSLCFASIEPRLMFRLTALLLLLFLLLFSSPTFRFHFQAAFHSHCVRRALLLLLLLLLLLFFRVSLISAAAVVVVARFAFTLV